MIKDPFKFIRRSLKISVIYRTPIFRFLFIFLGRAHRHIVIQENEFKAQHGLSDDDKHKSHTFIVFFSNVCACV